MYFGVSHKHFLAYVHFSHIHFNSIWFSICVCFVLGTTLVTENTIIDLPTGVVTFYMDTHEPRTPGCNPTITDMVYILLSFVCVTNVCFQLLLVVWHIVNLPVLYFFSNCGCVWSVYLRLQKFETVF